MRSTRIRGMSSAGPRGIYRPPAADDLHDALIEHRVGDAHESTDVRAADVVHEVALFAVLDARLVDRPHDLPEPRIDLLARPPEMHRVLRHLEARRRHAARVRRFARTEEDLRVDERVDRLR